MENATLRSKQLSHKNQETRWKYTECRQLDSHVERQIANVGHRFRHEENLLKFKSCPYSKDLPFENKSIMIADVVNEHNRAQSKQITKNFNNHVDNFIQSQLKINAWGPKEKTRNIPVNRYSDQFCGNL